MKNIFRINLVKCKEAGVYLGNVTYSGQSNTVQIKLCMKVAFMLNFCE
jgi:hypothetical protein